MKRKRPPAHLAPPSLDAVPCPFDFLPGEFDPAAFAQFPTKLPHSLGEIRTPAEMATAKHADSPPEKIAPAARQALAALVGSGPRQIPPHLDTAAVIGEGLARLRDHAAAGDAEALAALGLLLREAVADFAELARRQPEAARAWGRQQNTVPVLAGRNVGHRALLAADLAAFAVGEASPYGITGRGTGKQPDSTSPSVALAGYICAALAPYRGKTPLRTATGWRAMAASLPPLSRSNDAALAWFDAGWALLIASGFKTELSANLRHVAVKVGRASIRADKLRDALFSIAA